MVHQMLQPMHFVKNYQVRLTNISTIDIVVRCDTKVYLVLTVHYRTKIFPPWEAQSVTQHYEYSH